MTKDIYNRLLELLGDLTPLKTDCGLICGHACCAENEDLIYITLLPDEEQFLPDAMRGDVSRQEFPAMGMCDAYNCPGSCDRAFRPIMCRLFPLAPKIKPDGSLGVRMDARGLPICPLTRQRIAALDRRFVQAVRQIFEIMYADAELREYIICWSKSCDLFECPLF